MAFSTQESLCRGTQFFAFRSAVFELWGELGWSDVTALLSSDARTALFKAEVSPVGWIAERHMIALAEAVFAGPSSKQQDVYLRFVAKMIAHGFGRIRRFFVRFAPPELLLERAPDLWRHDHSHGKLEVRVEGRRAQVVLSDHIHTTTELSRLTAAESFRCALAQTRAIHVRASHRLDEQQDLEILLEWV